MESRQSSSQPLRILLALSLPEDNLALKKSILEKRVKIFPRLLCLFVNNRTRYLLTICAAAIK